MFRFVIFPDGIFRPIPVFFTPGKFEVKFRQEKTCLFLPLDFLAMKWADFYLCPNRFNQRLLSGAAILVRLFPRCFEQNSLAVFFDEKQFFSAYFSVRYTTGVTVSNYLEFSFLYSVH